MERLQGLLLWLLLSPSVLRASRGPLRPLCRPVNATLAAEKELCPVCITFTTSICAGYCPSMCAPTESCASRPSASLAARPV
ncbi:Luteinizing hormone beta subunit [Apodemus speciosus]|uniref:Luteinizing hormone beta subunit n=1 Tax=Apodemus speciosus TaxID=105296 RepID=A0ABQ0EYV3_APOSI